MHTIIIRQATITDATQLQAISRQTFKDAFAAVNTEADMNKYLEENLSLEKLTAELNKPGSLFYFAMLNDAVIGYLKLNYGAAQTDLKEDKGLEIERIYILQSYQSAKVGQQLFDKALQVAADRNAAYIWLGVWEHNLRAISFYERNGFVTFGKHAFMLGNDEQTDIMMRRDLVS